MQTLILNGSSRPGGDTEALIDALAGRLAGEVRTYSCHNRIGPCVDCRACWSAPGCSMDDEMQAVYPYLAACNTVVLASPIWFGSLSGPLLNIASRLQTLFAAKYFRGEPALPRTKNGVILLAGAQAGTEKHALQTATTILKLMGVNQIATICSLDTNCLPAGKDKTALLACHKTADALNHSSV